MERILNIAITGGEDLPIPAVHSGAVEVLIEELIKGNESNYRFNIDLYTVSDPLLDQVHYQHCNIIQMYPEELAKFPNKLEERTSPLGLAINERLKNKHYDFILVEHSMRVYHSLQTQIPLIYHSHADLDNETYRPKATAKEIVETSYCTLSVSQFIANAFNQILPSEKNKVFYNCIDFNVFNLNNVDHHFVQNFKKEHNIQENDFCFVFFGRVCPKKGVIHLVEAFCNLRKKYENIKLIIVGKPDFGKNGETDYTKNIKEISQGFENDIIYTGFVDHDNIPTVLSVGDCVVIPSICEEAFPLVALEAMAMKKPIISTISGGIVESLDENCAILINKGENITENLYQAMEKLLNNPELAQKMRDSGYQKVHSVYDFDSRNYFNNFCKIIQLENFF